VVKKERKRDNGRYAREGSVEEKTKPEQAGPAAVGAPRAKNCRAFARKRMAEEMPGIVSALIEGTKGGSVPHAKVLLELTGVTKDPPKPKVVKRRGKTLAGRLLEEIAEMKKQGLEDRD
jgi:hypothetical protein